MKLAIISPTLPPSHSGQAIVIYRLLNRADPNEYILISPTDYSETLKSTDFCSQKLPGKYFHIPTLSLEIQYLIIRADNYRIKFFKNKYLSRRIQKFKHIFHKEKCSHVIACSADLFDPYCAFMACKELKIPYYLYPFDDYIEQWINKYFYKFAQQTERIIAEGATSVIVPNEFLKKCYDNRYGIDSLLIHNPVDLSDYPQDSMEYLKYSSNSEINIIYTGAIYKATFDSIIRLADAITRIEEFKIKLHIYSPEFDISFNRYRDLIEYHSALPLNNMPDIQKNSHILFLPLAFRSDYSSSLINTSSPLKMGEYLAAGRPIIVNSPQDSYLSWYFKKFKCGVVVDSENIDDLSHEIVNLIVNKDYREAIISNAQKMAKTDFDVNRIKEKFFNLF
jgi:glycosyltransferase involved in cell wall biosynthesis